MQANLSFTVLKTLHPVINGQKTAIDQVLVAGSKQDIRYRYNGNNMSLLLTSEQYFSLLRGEQIFLESVYK